ncbi:TIGR01458 family HAD-type hydrolase [Frankia sp. CNm7]|uniref:Haloacid dehalogenase-like hydrolase domain-containing protein 2 n=1 Tax=Frankia nepalensis TaxID=1836974 RepID=A0A937REH5_9ACTN|nr:TIGR01458 family HAD-type hydrolase [Frankia nepalensis]MBL7496092.1 TIGR01458 family HAD-type hydrolase [Frankia nepalensis]MBL7511119.1 TIGR01458 family HAD-type hydrolase [Frankia nepalensis]MBL7522974.1 TIGR01458 family HAD-type hydrolase [Frankia nepalensis]MBL7630696.1 TIGR01458 family HAD-type hydrolase [Frankia nepalensis]
MACRAVFFDIDGVLTVSWKALPGAADAVRRIREAGLAVAFLTNTTSRSRASIGAALRSVGVGVADDEIITAAVIGAAYLRRRHPGGRVHLLNSGDVAPDLDGVPIAGPGERPDAVVLGGAGPEFTHEALTEAFRHVLDGAALVALHRNLYWATDDGLALDTGAYLAGLEQAAGVRASVVGKPAPEFFRAALELVGVEPGEAVMVGDDVAHDVLGAQAMGLTGVLVRTGKFREETLAAADAAPDHVVDSVADVPALLVPAAADTAAEWSGG